MIEWLVIGLVVLGVPLSAGFGAWVVYRLRYPAKTRAYVVCVDQMLRNGEAWWVAWIAESEGVVFASRSEDRAVAQALAWQSRQLKGEP